MNYKINRNKPEPSEEKISQQKDFSKILSSHKQVVQYKAATQPLYKNTKFMGFIILLSIVIIAFIITENESGTKEKSIKRTNTLLKDTIKVKNH